MKNSHERLGPFRQEYERNRKKILASQDICGICGKPVDKSLKYPDPWSATVDHIVPIAKGGHPADLDNLQLAHRCCNREKSDKIDTKPKAPEPVTNRDLPWSCNWSAYRSN